MHEAGVGFAIKTGLVGKLSGFPKGIDLLMTLKLPYAIMMTSQMKPKLSSTMIWIVLFPQHPSYKLIILGDLNVRVGTDYQA